MPEFRSLASLLKPEQAAAACVEIAKALPAPVASAPQRDEGAGREARLFYATLRERLDAAVAGLLEGIANEVLARELHLAPCDLEQIVTRLYGAYARHEPLRVRIHPGDRAQAAPCALPVYEDEALQAGDVVLELRDASVDARLHLRLADVLERPRA